MIQAVPKLDGDQLAKDSPTSRLDPESVRASISAGIREARLRHKLLGQPVVEWRDGQVVLVPAEEIEIVEPTQTSKTSDEQRTP
jgi:hypothetical protein